MFRAKPFASGLGAPIPSTLLWSSSPSLAFPQTRALPADRARALRILRKHVGMVYSPLLVPAEDEPFQSADNEGKGRALLSISLSVYDEAMYPQ